MTHPRGMYHKAESPQQCIQQEWVSCLSCSNHQAWLQAAEKQTSPAAAAASSTASRFAYNEIVEEETQKAPNVHRGKDGHLKLGSGGDFFSNPLGEAGASPTAAGPSRGSR